MIEAKTKQGGGEEQILHFFVWSIWRYFRVTTEVEPRVENPYYLEADPELSDFTAVITITGMSKGVVYFTIDRSFLERLFTYYPIEEKSETMLLDLAGEISNTIAGNVREYLGEGFLISTPRVVKQSTADFQKYESIPSFVLPISWEGYQCKLYVSLEMTPQQHAELKAKT